MFIKYIFRFFEPFRARLTKKFAKSANMTIQNFFKQSPYGYEKTEFDGEFESVEKVAKKFTRRKL